MRIKLDDLRNSTNPLARFCFWAAIAFFAVAIVLVLAGCGGGDSSKSAVTTAGVINIGNDVHIITPYYDAEGNVTHLVYAGESGNFRAPGPSAYGAQTTKVPQSQVYLACFISARAGYTEAIGSGIFLFREAGHEFGSGDVHVAKKTSHSRACGEVGADGTIRVTGVDNNDQGAWVFFANPTAAQFKLDTSAVGGWQRAGDLTSKVVDGFVEYGKHGYQPPSIDFQKGELRIDFGSNRLSGFNSLDGLFEPGDLEFVFSSDKEGYGRNSTRRGSLVWDALAEKYSVTIEGLTCGDRGNVTVFKKVGNTTIWQDYPFAVLDTEDTLSQFWQHKGLGIDFQFDALLRTGFVVLKC